MKKSLMLTLFIGLLAYASCKKSSKDTEPVLTDAVIDIQVLSQNLSFPWEITWGPDNMIWMTERGGKVSRVNPTTGVATNVISIADVKTMGEGGLLGMALHPSFTANPHVFVVYNYDKAGTYMEKVVRYTYNGITLTSPTILLDNIPASSIHNGSRLLISTDLKLFITTGDASNQPSAQNVSSVSGKVLRINLDGTIPSDNPISGNPVWSFGHRNPQGLVFANDKLYSSEHGPDRDDEVNIILKNRNFGWPTVNGLCDETGEQSFCNSNNVAQPIIRWTPTIAVSGMDYYNSNSIPQWSNSLILATLKDKTLYQLKLNSAGDKIDESKKLISGTYGRLRDVCVSPDGKVYVVTSNGSNDKIIVLMKK
ncbi:PQQ-dependent sugar dehydrogenase [Daejeonella sp.]|uniref:PQQ-dependent sugar dehydrogenase n=1 Tax=Daejeonella sp. TaxID=2805397 RepID=UPI0030C618C0